MKKTRIIIFGANADGENLYRQIKSLLWSGVMELLAFADNDSRLSGLYIEDVKIINPIEIINFDFDKIIIAPIFTGEIHKQLIELGVPAYKINFLYNEEYFSRKTRKFRSNTIGKYSYFKPTTQIFSTDIGSFCHIGDNCIIGQSGHDTKKVTTYPLGYHFTNTTNDPSLDESASKVQMESRTTIRNDVYIGEGVIIFAGIKVGNGAVIGTRSIVTKDVPDYAVVAGSPARIIKFRFSEEIIHRLLEISWWDWSDEYLQNHIPLLNEDPEKFIHKYSAINKKILNGAG